HRGKKIVIGIRRSGIVDSADHPSVRSVQTERIVRHDFHFVPADACSIDRTTVVDVVSSSIQADVMTGPKATIADESAVEAAAREHIGGEPRAGNRFLWNGEFLVPIKIVVGIASLNGKRAAPGILQELSMPVSEGVTDPLQPAIINTAIRASGSTLGDKPEDGIR